MGWHPPRPRQRHRVTIVLTGPIKRATFAAYHKQVEALARKYGSEAKPKLLRAPKPRAKAPKRRARTPKRRRRT